MADVLREVFGQFWKRFRDLGDGTHAEVVTLAESAGNAQLLSGVVTVAAAGTAEPGPDVDGNEFVLKAAAANTGIIYVGNDGADDVAVGTGYPLQPGEAVPVYCSNLTQLWFDASVNGEKCAWLRIR